jgi:hypothetical protein
MRDDLKGQNLTFTEIAKLVGENWQNLSPIEKETVETQALNAKEKYNQELAEYKKTNEFNKYSQYLHDFKQKQLHHTQGMSSWWKFFIALYFAKGEPDRPYVKLPNMERSTRAAVPASPVAMLP